MKLNELSIECKMQGFDEAIEKVSRLNDLLKETKILVGSLAETFLKLETDAEIKIENS